MYSQQVTSERGSTPASPIGNPRFRKLSIALGVVLLSAAFPAVRSEAAGSGRVIGARALTVYSQPNTSSVQLGSIPLNTTLALECAVSNGSSVAGPYGVSSLWHNIKFNNRAAWVPDAFVFTGTAALPPGEGYCRTGRADTLGGVPLQVWSTPTSGVRVATIANLSTITLYCGVTGVSASGKWGSSTLWHMVGVGNSWGYVPDAGVFTGVNGLPAGEYSCPSAPTSPIAPQPPSPAPRLGLPFAVGETWTASGTHDWNPPVAAGVVTTSVSRSSIDFSGGTLPTGGSTTTVRAAAAGTVRITSCGLVMIDHGSNLWTSYYHINKSASITSGVTVAAGTPLGTIGTVITCGGSASSPHVHFTIWNAPSGTSPTVPPSNSQGVHLNGRCVGGWAVADDPRMYWSSYRRVSDGVVVPSLSTFARLNNYGATC